MATRHPLLLTSAALLLFSGTTLAQPANRSAAPRLRAPDQIVKVEEPTEEQQRAYREAARRQREALSTLQRIKNLYFGTQTNRALRQEGIMKLREFTDPGLFPTLLEQLKGEQRDVRKALLEHLADQRTVEADATLAWAVVHDDDEWFRTEAQTRLAQRLAERKAAGEPGTPRPVQFAIGEALRQGGGETADASGANPLTPRAERMKRAAQAAANLGITELVPLLIAGQLGGASAGTGGLEEGDLAWILVGRQRAYVSDLEPIVGENAVAFDPELSVLTEGTVLRVVNAVVFVYRYDVHNALVDLTTRTGPRATASLGWDQQKWWAYYNQEYLPHLAKVQAEKADAERAAATNAPAPAPVPAKQPAPGGK